MTKPINYMIMMCISYFFSKFIRAPQMSFTWMLNHFVEGMPSENQILFHLCSSSSKFENILQAMISPCDGRG
jgi:hypothetical protein